MMRVGVGGGIELVFYTLYIWSTVRRVKIKALEEGKLWID